MEKEIKISQQGEFMCYGTKEKGGCLSLEGVRLGGGSWREDHSGVHSSSKTHQAPAETS